MIFCTVAASAPQAHSSAGCDPAEEVLVAAAAVAQQVALGPDVAADHDPVAGADLDQVRERRQPLGVGRVPRARLSVE